MRAIGAEELLLCQRRVIEKITAGAPLAETLDAVVREIESRSPGIHCSILLLDSDGKHLRHGAAPSLPSAYVRAVDGEAIGPRAGCCGTAAFRREAVIVEDIAIDPLWADYRELALSHGLSACWSTPIFDAKDRLLGTFAMYFARPVRPPAEISKVMETANHLAAIAIATGRSEEERTRLLAAADAAQREAERSRDLLAKVVERVTDGFVALDTDWRYTYVSPKAAKLLGRERPEDLAGKHIWTEFPDAVGGSFHSAYEKAIRTQQPQALEDCFEPWDRWFENRIYPSTDGLTIYFTDVSDQKSAEREATELEQAKRASERRLRNLFEQAADGIFVITPDHRYVDANAAGLSMLGYTLEELLELRLPEVLAEHERLRLDEGVAKMMAGTPHLVEWEHLRKDGSTFLAEVSARPLSGDEYMAIVRDLTARKEAEKALRDSDRRLRLAAEAGNVGLWDWDVLTDTVYYSAEWKRQIGYEDHEIGNDFTEWQSRVHPDDLDRSLETVRAFLDHSWPDYSLEFRFRHKDGSYRWILARASLLYDSDGKAIRMLGSHVDVTESKRIEEDLLSLTAELEKRVADRMAELEARNRELETFTYSVSHDLKAPLRGIDGYSRLLLEDYAERLDAEGRKFLHTIRQAAQQMNQLIDDLLAFSRLERRPLETGLVNIKALIESIVSERADEARKLGVVVTVDVAEATVTTDRQALVLAMRNLLDNALKFTRDASRPAIEIHAAVREAGYELSVRDNGIGFDIHFHDRIFDIFQRLHRLEDYPGTGIGLAIVRKAMERIGGKVSAESEPGRGATFFLEIPNEAR